jgi:hypothetical protein
VSIEALMGRARTLESQGKEAVEMAKTKADTELYGRLRDSGIRKRVAKRVAEALPARGQKKPARAHRLADELSAAAEAIRERAGGGSRKRSNAAKKAARTRKTKAAKRSSSAKRAAKTRR